MKNRLKKLREMALLSQYQLARESGVTRSRISLLENGDVEPGKEELATILRTLRAAHEKQVEEFAKLAGASEARAAA